MSWPTIIQGGMGVGVSGWRLARAVASAGELGVVSGTALEVQLARRLELGDQGGHLRQAMSRFPNQAVVARVLERYFGADGGRPLRRWARVPRARLESPRELLDLTVLAAFVEVDLARQGHSGVVGINLLQKIVLPTLPTLYGAILAGVDYVLVGAGIPIEIPAALGALAAHRPASLTVPVADDAAGDVRVDFDPALLDVGAPTLAVPRFLPIVAAASLAHVLVKRAHGPVDGFVIEAPSAGGHNAPPRGQVRIDERGQPLYGPRDNVDLAAFRSLGLPFWLAGGRGRPGCLAAAQAAGATGIQVGTAFAFCRESGIEPTLRRATLSRVASGMASVFTDPVASPTGFPFKVVDLPGTLAEDALYQARARRCDLGFLGRACRRPDGRLAFRCPAEPLSSWAAKGGAAAETAGRKCLCNALLANIGLGSRTADGGEWPLLTAGDDLSGIRELLVDGAGDYGASDVLRFLRAADPVAARSARAEGPAY